jgi:hypothetical protein
MTTTQVVKIGTINIPAGTIHKTYETAAWYTTFEYGPQICDLILANGRVSWTLNGTDTYEYFPSLAGGVAVGGGRIGPILRASTYTGSGYDYEYARLASEPNSEIVLDPGWTVDISKYDHQVFCLGYVTRYNAGLQVSETVPCLHNEHIHRGQSVTRKGEYVPSGYVPGEYNSKLHYRFQPAPVPALKGR